MMWNITFANPKFFFLLILLIPLIIWYVLKNNTFKPTLRVSETDRFTKYHQSWKVNLRHLIFGLRMLALVFIIIALARPQSSDTRSKVDTEGVDIMIALDISSSMLARDFKPDRIGAAKDLAIEFISGRPNDRIGLVIYSAESFTQCPLTTNHAVLTNFFKDIKSGMLEDGTAIGSGLATAVTRLKDSDAKSKLVILLTDGVNNSGSVPPLTAAELAQKFGIRVYTIGVGTTGMAPSPVPNMFGGVDFINAPVEIDEEILTQIAQKTNGQYFRATNNEKLREIYKEIDKLEKTKFQVTEWSKKNDEYLLYAMMAGLLFLLELGLRYTIFRTLP